MLHGNKMQQTTVTYNINPQNIRLRERSQTQKQHIEYRSRKKNPIVLYSIKPDIKEIYKNVKQCFSSCEFFILKIQLFLTKYVMYVNM